MDIDKEVKQVDNPYPEGRMASYLALIAQELRDIKLILLNKKE